MASPGSGEAWRVFCLSQALKVGKVQLGSVAAWDSESSGLECQGRDRVVHGSEWVGTEAGTAGRGAFGVP